MPNEEFELLKLKIHQLKEAEKVGKNITVWMPCDVCYY